MASGQKLLQKLEFKLTPQLLQLFSLIQTPNILLESKLKEEVEKNIVLEFDESANVQDNNNNETSDQESQDNYETPQSNDSQLANNDGDTDDSYYQNNDTYPEFEDKRLLNLKEPVSLTASLLEQIQNLSLTNNETQIATYIIGNLEDNGLLLRKKQTIVDELLFKYNLEISDAEYNIILKKIQTFEPAGIAATSLQQCLLLQLERLNNDGKKVAWLKIGKTIIEEYFDEFLNKNFAVIQKALSLNNADLLEVMNHLTKLNPKPGNTNANDNKVNVIIPDFIVYRDEEKIKVELTKPKFNRVKINTYYKHLYQQYQLQSNNSKAHKEAVNFLKDKIIQANQLIENVQTRDEMLLHGMKIIVEKQMPFFTTGNDADIKPMILLDIASVLKTSISTISKIINSKFVQTDFGVFSLKYFFGENFDNYKGDETNARQIKDILKDLLANEDKLNPLTDADLLKALEAKQLTITRRTVAKYRQQLNIPIAKMRKKMIE